MYVCTYYIYVCGAFFVVKKHFVFLIHYANNTIVHTNIYIYVHVCTFTMFMCMHLFIKIIYRKRIYVV